MTELEKVLNVENFGSEQEKALVNLLYTSKWIETLQMRRLKPFGLSVQQFTVLKTLKEADPQPLMLSQVQEKMLDKMSNSSRLVDKLIEKGLVVRNISKTDRRQVEILLTKQGVQLYNQLNDFLTAASSPVETLSKEEAKKLNAILDKLRS